MKIASVCTGIAGFDIAFQQADGPRYRQLGNAVAVPVVEWIARRIALVDTLTCHSQHDRVSCSP